MNLRIDRLKLGWVDAVLLQHRIGQFVGGFGKTFNKGSIHQVGGKLRSFMTPGLNHHRLIVFGFAVVCCHIYDNNNVDCVNIATQKT